MKRQYKKPFLILITAFFISPVCIALDLEKHPEIKQVSDQLVADGVYTDNEIEALFAKVNLKPKVVEAFKKPAEKLTWAKYRGLFITDKVIKNGVKFWQQHESVLSKASNEFGVPVEIIVAILGVETRFGKSMGSHAVINSLSTLSIDFERRKEFFQSELLSFLKLAKSDGVDALNTQGSYAGAMGIPQFIASSYQAYAIDYDGDGRRDLIGSYADAIGSVANYFKQHNWLQGAPVKTGITKIDAEQFSQFRQTQKSAQYNVTSITDAGVKIDGEFSGDLAADVIELNGSKGKQYELVFENFYVIKRYNQSNLYAMAISELSEAIKNKRSS